MNGTECISNQLLTSNHLFYWSTMVANRPTFLPRLVPHVFGHWQSTRTPSRRTGRSTSMPDYHFISPSPMTITGTSNTNTTSATWLGGNNSNSDSSHTTRTLYCQGQPDRPTTLSFLDAIVNGGVHDTAIVFLHYYEVHPRGVLSIIAHLVSGNENDHRNLSRLLRAMFEANQRTATAILHNYLSGRFWLCVWIRLGLNNI